MNAVNDLVARLLAIEWHVDFEEPAELTKERVAHFREYLRRAAPYASLRPGTPVSWPWFDVAACVDPSIRADDDVVEAVSARIEGGSYSGVRMSCAAALHFAALRDAGAVPRYLADPFEPLVRVYELGGLIGRDCSGGFMEFGCMVAAPIHDQRYWERQWNPALHGVLERAAAAHDAPLLELLSERLSGADLTSLLLEVYRRRALDTTPTEVMRRYRTDRFVTPSEIPALSLRRTEDALIAALPPSFELLALAPVTPLATHSSVATVDPRKVIATIRNNEVAADPTNALALEAAARRSALLAAAPRSTTPVHLAASQRVVRAQQFAGSGFSAHFQLFGLVSAGRDVGGRSFEREALTTHLRFAAEAAGAGAEIRLTLLDPAFEAVIDHVTAALAEAPGVRVVLDPDRESGRGYYAGLCFKVHAGDDGEVGDGGFTHWTARLLGNGKERLLISGYGVDRLVG
jgi:hypothetical protein